MHADDMDLVQEFAARHSETAFATLVERHINLVYSVALRSLGDPHEAEEVTQAVFVILARKATGLRKGTVLSGWLYQTAQLTAANFQRAAQRRRRREQEAYMQFAEQSDPDPSWQRMSPLLEEAMMRLGKDERDAVVLRFFENRTVREVAARLGLHEAAAQKRVNRATEKLRVFFARRGIQVSTAVLLSSIGANAVQAAPASLASTVTATAAVKSAAVSTSTLTLIKTTLKLMAWTQMKTVAVGTVIVAVVATTTLVVRHQTAEKRNTSTQEVNYWSRASFADLGRQTPEATFITMLWAMSNTDTNTYLTCCTPEQAAKMLRDWRGKSAEALAAEAGEQMSGLTGVRILDRSPAAGDRMIVSVSIEGIGKTLDMTFRKIGQEWKYAGNQSHSP